jgi:hypothetical protein
MSYFRFGTGELRPSETRDIIAAKIDGVIPIREPFRLAAISSAIIQDYVSKEECLYPEIPIWDQVVGRDNTTHQARQDYYFFSQLVGARVS